MIRGYWFSEGIVAGIRATTACPRVVINTRPLERAAPLSAALAASKHTVVELPLLTLQPRQASQHDALLMQRWLRGAYAVTVVVSPTAAAMAIEYWQQAQLDVATATTVSQIAASPQPSHIIAVGDATAAVLRDHGLTVQQPLMANNEGMLQMPLIAELKPSDQVLMWRGLGGRRLLVETLRQRGINVDSIAWYERIWPPASAPLYQQWMNDYLSAQSMASAAQQSAAAVALAPVVIISSGAAFEYWQHLVTQTNVDADLNTNGHANNDANNDANVSLDKITGKAPRPTSQTQPTLQLADFDYIVLGDRLAAFLHEQHLTYHQVETLDPATIVAAVAKLSPPL